MDNPWVQFILGSIFTVVFVMFALYAVTIDPPYVSKLHHHPSWDEIAMILLCLAVASCAFLIAKNGRSGIVRQRIQKKDSAATS